MIFTLLLIWIVSLISLIFDIIHLPIVTELPFGGDQAIAYFVGTIHGIATIMPWMTYPMILILAGLGIKFLLFTWYWAKWLIQLVRGSG